MADQPNVQDILTKAYQNAPPPVQEYIDSGKLSELATHLKSRFNLSEEMAGGVSNELVLAVLGLSDPRRFATNLTQVQEIPAPLVAPITEEVNTTILFPLRDKLAALTKKVATPRPPAVVSPAPPINRLAPPPVPKLIQKESVPVPAPKPAPVAAPAAPVPSIVVPPVKIVPAPTPAVPAKPVVPPLGAAPAPTPVKKRPGETTTVPFTGPSPIKKADPYREPVE